MKDRHLAVVTAFCAALAACGGDAEVSPAQPNNLAGSNNHAGADAAGAGGSTASNTGGTPSGGGTQSGGSAGTAGSAGSTCTPGIPATSQIPRLLKRQYDAVMRDLLGVTTLASAGNKSPASGLYADFDGPMNVDALRLYHEVARKVVAEVMSGPNRARFIGCDPAAPGCLTETIRSFGRKAFRRPLTDAELARFAKLGEGTPPPTPEQFAELVLFSFLVSPSFLQLTELVNDLEGGAIKLSSYEVAARLSFLLWGSIPDDVLNAAADNRELETKAQILAQAERMLGDREKAAPLVAAYHRTYLDMDNEDSHWWKSSHDVSKFPHYSDAAVPALQGELDRFFEEVAFGGGSFEDLFLSNVGFVNQDTAALYGLDPAAYGAELERVELDAAQRPGFLTRAGFLSSFSHFDATSPILRGAFITVNIIGMNPGAPDPDFFLTPPPPGPHYTERAYVEALTSQPACTGCHTPFINPPGFVLENYDSTGKWQTIDPRSAADPALGAIDATATVTFSADNVKTIRSPAELMQEIARTPLARRIYATKAVAFATGRVSNPADACTIDAIDGKMSRGGYTLLNLLADLTQADSFRLRAREN